MCFACMQKGNHRKIVQSIVAALKCQFVCFVCARPFTTGKWSNCHITCNRCLLRPTISLPGKANAVTCASVYWLAVLGKRVEGDPRLNFSSERKRLKGLTPLFIVVRRWNKGRTRIGTWAKNGKYFGNNGGMSCAWMRNEFSFLKSACAYYI